MPLQLLNHYTIEPSDMEATKDFYVDVLGLSVGDRPPLGFPGYWLYSGGHPTVHLLGPREARDGMTVRPPSQKFEDTGRLDHIAFTATGLAEIRGRLKKHKVKYREQVLPRINATQLFVFDPDGVGVELNFPPSETGT
jgi:catechol 2,3-dioxygenase-like lactoylglutathione lyase family enzyme